MMPLATLESSREDARWLRQLLHFAMQATRISCATFYWIDDRYKMKFAASEGVDGDRLSLYQSKFHAYDPCRPARLIAMKAQLQTLQYACQTQQDDEIELYRPYIALSGINDAMDMLFWHDERPIAGLGIMAKGDDTPFVAETIMLAQSLRHYVEASLAFHPYVLRDSARYRLKDRFHLTTRELAVAELIEQGLTNREIGEDLDIALPTVKTHVQSLFRKLDVGNRTSLVAKLRAPMPVV